MLDRNFQSNVSVVESGCWLWIGPKTYYGYGRFSGKRAHRLAYERAVGPIPNGLTIDHLCRIRACVNPAHLEAVEQRENLLRSPKTQASINSAKTHCIHGHSLVDARIYDGKRECRECERLRARRRRARSRFDWTLGEPVAK